MKTLICSLNSQYIHSSLAPWYLLAGIKEYSVTEFETVVFESTVNEKWEITLNKILEEKPDVVGFSCYIWNIIRVKLLVEKVKENLPLCKIILGGPEVSYNPQDYLNNNFADYVISGEGEKPLALLLDSVNKGDNPPAGFGISYFGNIAEPYLPCDEPPSPYGDEYFSLLNGRITYIETSRGCPFSCAFCLSGRCGGVRFFDMEKSLENIVLLANSGSKTVKFVDRTFNAHKKRAKEIVRFIIDNYGTKLPDDVCFHFEIAGDILDDELISLFNTAPLGSIQLEIGLQSFNPDTLLAVTRKTDIQKLTENILALLKPNNIHIHIDLIAGLPLEGYESFRESFNTAFAINPHMLQLGFLKILFGSPLFDDRHGISYSSEPPYEVTKTPWLNETELLKLHQVDHALETLYCSGRFRDTVYFLIEKLNLTPFDFFQNIGEFLNDTKTPYQASSVLMEYGKDFSELRDIMAVDWLSTNASGKLPDALKIPDGDLKHILIYLEQNKETRRPKNTKRGIAILYSENSAIYIDYNKKNPVTGKFHVNKIPNYKEILK